MSYTIKSIKFLESAKGNKYAKATFSDGKEVAIFDKFPGFSDLKEGSVVDGDLAVKDYNGGKSYTLNPFNKQLPSKGGNAAISKAMDKKIESISKSQDRKEESIKLAGIQRDAVLIVTTFYPEVNSVFENDIPGKEQYIRERLMEWKKHLEQTYGDGQPF